jgi:hypothetical protein
MTLRGRWQLSFARSLMPILGLPPRRVAVWASSGLREALGVLGYGVIDRGLDAATTEAATQSNSAADLALAIRPKPQVIVEAAAALRDGGRLVVIDRGLRAPPREARTYALSLAGFSEVAQSDVGRLRQTTGVRIRLFND